MEAVVNTCHPQAILFLFCVSTCYVSNTHHRDKRLCISVFLHLTVSVLDHDQIYNKGDCPSRAHTCRRTCTSVCSCVSLCRAYGNPPVKPINH